MPDRPRTRRGIATVCLSGTLEDKLTAAADAGFDGVEIFENDLIAAPSTPDEIRRRCADLGLSIDLYQPFRDFEAVPDAVFERNLRRAEHKFALMRQLGADTVLVCSSVSPDAVDDDDLAAGQLHVLGERAAEHGIRVAYEALAWGRFVSTWDHSWRIVARADHPAVGLCLDSFHVLSRTSDIAGIADIPAEKLFFLQLADAPRLDMNVLQWSRHHRLFPGQGAFDLPDFLDHVLRAGYAGPWSLEVFNDIFRQAEPRRTAVDAFRSLLHLEEAHGLRSGTASLPAAPELAGHAFTELVVDQDSGARVGAVLATLGFAHTGQHRSKPVQLWRQGEARVLVNATRPDETAEIGALGLESADPTRSAERAEALLAPVLPRTRGGTEADLSAIAAPDGTSLFFCRTEADWLSDFTPTGAGAGTVDAGTGVGLTRTDHVTLAQPFDAFDEATLFYRSVLGLEPHDDAEYAAPFGLVRSRSVGDAAGTVRIMLTGTLLRRGDWAPGVPDPQHVAFATDDIFACAAAMRALGAPLLSISDNYYADLDARLAPDPGLLTRMREHGVLYDRDQHGEFFHLYTELVGSRVFFEVVQRIGGYAGYGAVNAPVRMAAHRRHRLARTG
ncbi:bifunctional sugar phosphate isomerase/epimerase/4-hydroxyphenylpyruvate dioxygenase family protein [Saccharothrix deserti]|uniref:bifunctional sugar phosphate isomerase/epimerase/4-hydroxyphenylpyruvate dioxygenase family protein n=1 Tax=Saccharothrix deserti TaxID=2593674 RepID=UPI00131BCEFA|nr:sugar phosphate isomerase/epimerase and 4-hydroxyphenylpyruvate domain-containing protein [Saccharothrix deserti]